jgi:sodium transport system ATP-binding protein
MIHADGLTKVFHDRKRGELRAADGVSFRAEPGRIYGLLGANGAGKTTTLRMLATLLQPTAGTATVAGFDIRREPDRVRASIGFLSSATALYGRLTAREMVLYAGQLHGLPDALLHERVRELSERLDMAEFATRRCDKLSTGQKQRVSIARTLVHDPQVVILDEPTLGLDVFAARSILEFIRGCRDRGKTVVFSTHVMTEVEKLCDRVGIIHKGRLLEEGTLDELRVRHGVQDMEEIFVRAASAADAATPATAGT